MAEHTNKEVVITMRNALKGGNKYLPLRVYGDNAWIIVDEARVGAFTKWDDENGVLYYFRMPWFDDTNIPQNTKAKNISVGAIKYEFIQTMEVSPLPLKYLDDVVSSIKSTGVEFSDEFKELIRYVFDRLLDPNRVQLTPDEINQIVGAKVMAEADNYYKGKFAEPKFASYPTRIYNQGVEEEQAKKAAEEAESNG